MEASHTETLGRLTLQIQIVGQGKRIWLENGALHRLMVEQPTPVRVLRGAAWITHNREDILLQAGQRVQLTASRESTLVGALGEEPLIVQVG